MYNRCLKYDNVLSFCVMVVDFNDFNCCQVLQCSNVIVGVQGSIIGSGYFLTVNSKYRNS